ncbi:MAG: PaaI family thioesterase [Candidatus Eiseniibacteriota bacterium]|jgi:acyl-coenzyme A thioesterase PaaI-like protein
MTAHSTETLSPTRSTPSFGDVNGSQSTLEALAATEHADCLLCGRANPVGLRLRFRLQSDGSVLAAFTCREAFQSYAKTLHGGVISALLDAAMTNVLFSIGVVGVTAELTVRFLAPVLLERAAVVRATLERNAHPLFLVRAELEQDGKLMARASAKFLARECL